MEQESNLNQQKELIIRRSSETKQYVEYEFEGINKYAENAMHKELNLEYYNISNGQGGR